MKYTVHLYYAVRIRMEDIEADSQEEAFKKAQEECDVRESLAHGAFEFEFEESLALGALVDEEDDDYFNNSRYHEGDGAKLYLAVEGEATK